MATDKPQPVSVHDEESRGWQAASRIHTTKELPTPMTNSTVFDVAELAGVSIKTVSRVVNSEPHVRASTRQRVDQAIAKLDYRPDEAARKLASHRLPRNI